MKFDLKIKSFADFSKMPNRSPNGTTTKLYVYLRVCIYGCMHIDAHFVCVGMCIHARTCIYVCVFTYIYPCVCAYIHIYVYLQFRDRISPTTMSSAVTKHNDNI